MKHPVFEIVKVNASKCSNLLLIFHVFHIHLNVLRKSINQLLEFLIEFSLANWMQLQLSQMMNHSFFDPTSLKGNWCVPVPKFLQKRESHFKSRFLEDFRFFGLPDDLLANKAKFAQVCSFSWTDFFPWTVCQQKS